MVHGVKGPVSTLEWTVAVGRGQSPSLIVPLFRQTSALEVNFGCVRYVAGCVADWAVVSSDFIVSSLAAASEWRSSVFQSMVAILLAEAFPRLVTSVVPEEVRPRPKSG